MSARYALMIASLSSIATPALAGARQDAKVLMDDDPNLAKYEEEWGFASAVVVDGTIYLSGIVAGLRDGETDLQVAYVRAFERIETALRRAGASWDDVVDMTTFHTDVTTQLPAIVAVKQRYVKPPYPAWTAIQVSRLIPPNGITEIKVTARLPANRPKN